MGDARSVGAESLSTFFMTLLTPCSCVAEFSLSVYFSGQRLYRRRCVMSLEAKLNNSSRQVNPSSQMGQDLPWSHPSF
jgi:hypothetical protein